MIIVKGGVTTPRGFLANGVKAGIKPSGRKDLAVLYSEVPAVAAGAFTTSAFRASPVRTSIAHLRHKFHQAIIVNSGNANCANGRTGDRDSLAMAGTAARLLGLRPEAVLVASTGIIGVPLPIEKIRSSAPGLVAGMSGSGGPAFSETIMTTDTIRKEYAVKIRIGSATVSIGGACKGVGMIYPEMRTCRHATMLGFISTDAAISKRMLETSLDAAMRDSFNMVSVDGDMSTNDSCFVMANGLAGNRRMAAGSADHRKFTAALTYVAGELAKMLARDGEGATKLIEIEVRGAASGGDARAAARKISTSNLLKCAVFGGDPNWGRICAAAGASTAAIDPDRMDIYLGPVKALSNGMIAPGFSKEKARRYFKGRDVRITVDLKLGKHRATAWTCDLSKEYVTINSEYST